MTRPDLSDLGHDVDEHIQRVIDEQRYCEAAGIIPPIDSLCGLFTKFRLAFGTEQLLQADVAKVLARNVPAVFDAEHILDARSRIDFYSPHLKLGIECKVEGGFSLVVGQLLRYLQHDAIEGIVLVTRCRGHRALPRLMNGKPVRVAWIAGGAV